ncbi:MAG: rRNA maturation RNase YbeY [Clostridia bacterium]|nr:rRNA maturation RNase YbeY [Clostridia bacterium]
MAISNKIYISRRKRGLGQPDAYLTIRRAVDAALSAEGVDMPCELYVMLTDDAGIRAINLETRGIDAATDVLSFPLNDLVPGGFNGSVCEKDPGTGRVLLGDMVLSVPRCEAQGEEFGHGFNREVTYLAIHSVLHLLGYDHIDEDIEKRRMRSREKAIMSLLGAPEPD